MTGERFGLVVEIDEQGLVEAGLEEAVGVAVVAWFKWFAGQEAGDVAGECFALEVGDRPGLGGRHIGGVTDHKDICCGLGLQGVFVGRHETELVAQTRRSSDAGGAAVQRDHDRQVELNFTAVVPDQPPPTPSTSPVLNSVITSMLRSDSLPPSCLSAIGLVNAPSTGVT